MFIPRRLLNSRRLHEPYSLRRFRFVVLLVRDHIRFLHKLLLLSLRDVLQSLHEMLHVEHSRVPLRVHTKLLVQTSVLGQGLSDVCNLNFKVKVFSRQYVDFERFRAVGYLLVLFNQTAEEFSRMLVLFQKVPRKRHQDFQPL
jgi:hypothetical protein